MRHFFQCSSSSEKGLQTRAGFAMLHRPISLHFGTVGSLFSEWEQLEIDIGCARSAKLPCELDILQGLMLLSRKLLFWYLGTGTSGDRIVSGVSWV